MSKSTFKPNFVAVDGDFDHGTEVAIFPEGMSLRAILASLDLTNENRHGSRYNVSERRYRDSGLWYVSGRTARVLVGCACEHDCCGHLCGLSYEFLRSEQGTVVISNWSRNF